MSAVRVKVCGLSTEESVLAAKEAGADFTGFVFFPASPRNISPGKAAALAALAPGIPAVAVTVTPSDEQLASILSTFSPAYLQLHGKESPARVAEVKAKFGLPVIKALSISNGDDIAKANAYESVADMLMFDARAPKGMPGGNGLAFDWQLLSGRSFSKPWFLSGGLNTDNLAEAVRISGAKLVDASSSLETEPGKKSPELIRTFVVASKAL